MTMLYIESWDGIATADLAAKGWVLSGSPTIQSSVSRTGSQALSSSNRSVWVSRSVAAADEHDTFIVGFAYRMPSLPSSEDTAIVTFSSDSATTDHVTLAVTTSGALRVFRGVSTNTQLGSSTAGGLITAGAWNYIELKAKLHDTTGTVDVKVNNANVLSLTGQDTKNGGTKTVFDSFRLGSTDGRQGVQAYHDDVYLANGAGSVNNTFIGDCRIRCLAPSGNGNSSQWVGSDADSVNNYQNVDEATPSTADYNGSSTSGDKDTYAYGDLPDTTGTINGVQINSHALKSDAGSRSLAHVTRHSGTDYDSADLTLSTSAAILRTLQETNPGTSAAWTISQVNAAEFGVKCRP